MNLKEAVAYFEQECDDTERKLSRANEEFESLIAEEGQLSERKSDLEEELGRCQLRAGECKAEVEHSEKLVDQKKRQVTNDFV